MHPFSFFVFFSCIFSAISIFIVSFDSEGSDKMSSFGSKFILFVFGNKIY